MVQNKLTRRPGGKSGPLFKMENKTDILSKDRHFKAKPELTGNRSFIIYSMATNLKIGTWQNDLGAFIMEPVTPTELWPDELIELANFCEKIEKDHPFEDN